MITISLELFILLFVLAGLLTIFALWLYYDRRDRHLYDAQRLQRAFHCVKCDSVYAAPPAVDEKPCPRCGFTNGYLHF